MPDTNSNAIQSAIFLLSPVLGTSTPVFGFVSAGLVGSSGLDGSEGAFGVWLFVITKPVLM